MSARNAVERAAVDAVNAVLGPGWRPVDTTESDELPNTWYVELRHERTGERIVVDLSIEAMN